MEKRGVVGCVALGCSVMLYASLGYAVPPNTVVATINVGVTPAGIAVTPDGRFAYVANNNNYGIAGQDSVSVLNLANNTLLTTIFHASFNQPYTVTINAAGTIAYVTNSNSTTITMINIATNTVIGTIGGFDGPSGMVITPAGTVAYVNNYGGPEGLQSGNGTTVRTVDLTTNMIFGPAITVGQAPAALAITPDGAFVYVASYVNGMPGQGTISVIQTSNNTVVQTIPNLFGPFGIAITPNGADAYVTNFGSNNFFPFGTTVSVVNLATNDIITTVTCGIQPSGVAITPDGRFAYVSNYDTLYTDTNFSSLVPGQGTVNIIDTATNTIIPPIIAVGQSPDSVAIAPNGEFAYVTNYTSNSVSVIALQSFQIVAQGCQMKNQFLMYTELVNKLTWTVTGTSLPVAYAIYRDAQLTDVAGTIAAGEPLEFFDHNRVPDVTYTYYIVGTNAAGTTSVPVAVAVTESC